MRKRRAEENASLSCFKPREFRYLAYILCESSQSDDTSFSHDMRHPVDAKVLDSMRRRVGSHEPLRQVIRKNGPLPANDVFVLSSKKKVNVSSEGNRGVSVGTEAMAIKAGCTRRVIGSISWRSQMLAPKWRMRSIFRRDPLGRRPEGSVDWKVLKNEKNALSFELAFSPALRIGEIVRYGFYVWNRRHFAMSRTEAEERYRDKWIREGLAVRGPTERFEIAVRVPRNFRVHAAILEKDPILNQDGPNDPGLVVRDVRQRGRALEANMHLPESGRYFLSWIPPG